MKKIMFLIAAFVPAMIFAQTEGEIIFEEKVSFQIELPEGMEELKDQIPSSQTLTKSLLFNDKATLYKDLMMEEAPEEVTAGSEEAGVMFKMKFDRPENSLFCDLEKGTSVEFQEFMGKKFLISGDIKKYKWKMTGEQKTILDFACQKAIYKDTARTVVAWFTPAIPVSIGPGQYGGLPGMILEMDFNDGERIIVANKIEMKKLEKNAIQAPTKGKKVTREEYDKIVKEKMDEMHSEFGGGGGGTKIIIRN